MPNVKTALVAALGLLLTACFLMPGTFVSDMTVAKDGSFTFSYKGEILLISSPQVLDEMAKGDGPFTPMCVDDDGEERPCSADETAEQKIAWEAEQAETKKKFQQFVAAFGGIDPTNPASIDAFAARLQKQKGWNSVRHLGQGVFEVDYSIAGTLDRDFFWPIFPDTQYYNPFVVAMKRADGSVMIKAPGYTNKDGSEMLGPMASNADIRLANGVFTLSTDAEIATNNTEDGPSGDGAMRTLRWHVAAGSDKVPETLLKLDR